MYKRSTTAKGRREDTIRLRGSLTLAASTGSTGNGVIDGSGERQLDLNSLGDRPAVAGSIFLRWRIVSLNVTYVPTVGSTTAGSLSVAIKDDVPDEESAVTTYASTVDLRCHAETQIWGKCAFGYKPADPTKWYYCQLPDGDYGSSLVRFGAPGTIVANGIGLSASTTYGEFIIRYELELRGSTPSYTLTLVKVVRDLLADQTRKDPAYELARKGLETLLDLHTKSRVKRV